VKRAPDCEGQLAECLNEREQQLLDTPTNAQHRINRITALEDFILGFRFGVRLISCDSTKGCVLPKLEKKEMKILPPESLGTFFEEAKRSGVFELYYIDLATGLRRGELPGLK